MYSIQMINTYNESSLHKMLKNMCCAEVFGKTEVEIDDYICDVQGRDLSLIEVQTKNLGNLTGKIACLLQKHYLTLVYPLPLNTFIEYYEDGKLEEKPLSRRKSPNKKNIYHIFDEIMGCFPILLHSNFTLKVIEVNITKERIKTQNKVQSANKKRRFLKDWVSYDTTLDEVFNTHVFKTKEDYLALLPKNLGENFTVSDILKSAKNETISKQQAYKMIWTFNKMGIIEYIGKDERSKVYRIINNCGG